MTRPLVSVVLPCLNEAGSVGDVIREIQEAFAAAGIHGEVIVADNGSDDGSPDLARDAGARVVHVPLRGYGAALTAGFAAADGEICVMGDADLTYPFDRLVELIAPVQSGEADMTIGSRWIGTTAQTMPFLHRFVGTPVISWLVRRAGGPSGITDSQSGFRAFRREALAALGLRTTGMEFASEMLILAGRAGWRIQEMPTGYRERVGESKLDTFSDGWRHLKTILLLAPNLAATLPGLMLAGAGAVGLAWALVDSAIVRPGSPAWIAGFFGPAALVLGIQAVLAGLLLASVSPLTPGGRQVSSTKLLSAYSTGGAWGLAAGTILCAALVGASIAGLPAPFRAPQVQMLALVLLLVGGSALGGSVIAHFAIERARRYAPAVSAGASASSSVRLIASPAAVDELRPRAV
jgi:hypothetical protein